MTKISQPAMAAAKDAAPIPAERRAYIDWSAILAGSVIATASMFVLMTFGAAVGLSFVSPFSTTASGAAAVGVGAIVWLALAQIYSFGMGGYVCGRMRAPAGDAKVDETAFRDNVNGLLVWAVGIALSALLVASAAGNLASGVARGGAAGVASAASATANNPASVFDAAADVMFRPADAARPSPQDAGSSRAEAARILASSLASGGVSGEDRAYLAQIVSSRTGLAQPEAEKRVNDAIGRANAIAAKAAEAAETTRKAAVSAGFWGTLIILLAALTAWWAGGLGGRHRDEGLIYWRG